MEDNFQFASAAVSDRGLSEKRPQNEDSYLELRRNGVFAVADGVGGAQAGDVASQMAVEILGEAFINLPNDVDAEEIMRVAIVRANDAIYQMSNDLPQLSSMATTIAALHITGNIATIGHVGDSRVYRIDPDGTLKRETQDHSVVEEEVRAGRMTPEQALTHPSRNVISRALGAEREVEVDMKTIMVEPGTMFLLCSDGITRHIGDDEIEKLFNAEIEPEILCDRMKQICYSRGAEDNLTAVVVRISTALAGSFAAAAAVPTSFEPAFEEETVATARPATENESLRHDTIEIDHPGLAEETRPAENFADLMDSDEQFLLDDAGQLYEDEPARQASSAYASSSVVVPAQSSRSSPHASQESHSFSYEVEKPSGAGKILQAVGLLALGALLGIGGYYLLASPNPEPEVPVLNDTKGSNITMVVFEETRRLADQDPARFLAANAATPDSAQDHYFLGRAQLLTGKYVEAKRQFTLARERLAQTEPVNAKTLANEIALGIAIADNQLAGDTLTRELNSSAANSNTNVSTNINSPLR